MSSCLFGTLYVILKPMSLCLCTEWIEIWMWFGTKEAPGKDFPYPAILLFCPRQLHHALNMLSMGEHIHGLELLHFVVVCLKEAEIPGEGFGVAGNIHRFFGGQGAEGP